MTANGPVDFVIATVNVTRPDPTGGPYDVEFVRTIVAPHGVPNLRIPQVTNPLYNPVADDSIAGSLALVSVTGGYDGARNKLFAYPSITDVAPMNGRMPRNQRLRALSRSVRRKYQTQAKPVMA